MAAANPFDSLGQAYEQAANSIVSGSISNLISAITPVITAGLILYIIITGYMVVSGRIQDPISDVLIKLCKWSIIGFIALNAGTITDGIISGFNGIENTIIGGFTNNPGNVYQQLDQTLEDGLSAAADIVRQNDKLNFLTSAGQIFRNLLAAVVVSLAVILQTCLAGAIIILAKASFLVVAALAPLLLSGLFFPQTAKFADAWFNQAFNFTLTIVIAIFFQQIAVSIFQGQVDDILNNIASVSFISLGKLVIIAIINFFAVKQAPNIASGLSGGVASSSASLMGAARNAIAVGAGATAVVRHGITGNGGDNNNGKKNNDKQKHSIARRATSAAARSAGRFAGRTISRINKGRNRVSNKN